MTNVLLDLSVLATPARTRGIGRYVAELARTLAPRAAERQLGIGLRAVEHLDWTGPASIAEDVVGAGCRLARGERALSHAAWAYRVRIRLWAAARLARADLLHTPHPEATPLGRACCPRVTTCHDLIELAFPEHYVSWREGWAPGRRRLDARRYRNADHVIAVSRTSADELVRELHVPSRKITVVHHGVDFSRFSAEPAPGDAEVRARHGLAAWPYFLYAGGADWRKNPEGMLAAMAALARSEKDAPPLLAWAGRLDERDRTLLRELAVNVGAERALRLLGFVSDEDLAALTRGAVAVLFVSRAEGFGYPIIESMATGCPVITSDRSSMAEIAGDAALLVDPESPAAIASAARTLLRDETERRRLRERGLTHCRKFSCERMADATLDVYRRLIA